MARGSGYFILLFTGVGVDIEKIAYLRRLTDAAMTSLEALAVALDETAGINEDGVFEVTPETCPHPLELREDMSTPGWTRWICKVPGCGYEFEREVKRGGSDGEDGSQ